MKDSELSTKAKAFECRVISVCNQVDTRERKSILVDKIMRSAISVGINVHNANYASSKMDTINKLNIALEKCKETEYLLEMLFESNRFTDNTVKEILHECEIIRRMLVESVLTAKHSNL